MQHDKEAKMKNIPKDSWNMIQQVIRRYPENKEIYDNKIEELTQGSPSQDGQPRGNYPTNRLEEIAIKLDTPYMQRMRREIKAVEDAYSQLREDYKKIIRIRFWSDRYKNMPYMWMTRCVSYSERQIRRVCKAFVREVGENLGEL